MELHFDDILLFLRKLPAGLIIKMTLKWRYPVVFKHEYFEGCDEQWQDYIFTGTVESISRRLINTYTRGSVAVFAAVHIQYVVDMDLAQYIENGQFGFIDYNDLKQSVKI